MAPADIILGWANGATSPPINTFYVTASGPHGAERRVRGALVHVQQAGGPWHAARLCRRRPTVVVLLHARSSIRGI